MRSYLLTLSAAFALCFAAPAQKPQKLELVEGEYTYQVPPNVTRDQAVRIAVERAQLEALTARFGQRVTQQNSTTVTNVNGRSDVTFTSVGGSEVDGYWIEDVRRPEISWSNDGQTLSVSVKGLARRHSGNYIDLQARVLRNGTADTFEDTAFRDRDTIYVALRTPTDGFAAIYYADADGRVYRLLPDGQTDASCQSVKADRRHLFFGRKDGQFVVTCDGSFEFNRLYLLFSTKPFVRPTEDAGDIPSLTFGHFQRWLTQLMKRDETLQRLIFPINISPRPEP